MLDSVDYFTFQLLHCNTLSLQDWHRHTHDQCYFFHAFYDIKELGLHCLIEPPPLLVTVSNSTHNFSTVRKSASQTSLVAILEHHTWERSKRQHLHTKNKPMNEKNLLQPYFIPKLPLPPPKKNQSSESSHPTKLGQSKIFQQLWLVNMDLLGMDCNTISEKRFFQTWNKYPKLLQPWEHQKKEKKNLSRKSFKESSDAYLISRAGWVPSLLAILHLSNPFQSGPIPSMSNLGKKNTESNCTWR